MDERDSPGALPPRVVIYTAAIGGGHRALAAAIRDDLAERGQEPVVLDGLRELSRLTAWLAQSGYVFQLKFAPWSIRPLFVVKTQPVVAAWLRVFYGLLYGWRLRRSIARTRPDLIVSTFPLITTILHWLRRTGRLQTPVVTVIADYGTHAMWVGPATDLHLVSSDRSRELVERVGGRADVNLMPVARPFRAHLDRGAERARLGLPADRFVALIACGAWGVGDIAPAVAAALAAGAYPVVVTGNNAALRARLDARYPDPAVARVLGWTSEMPGLMAAGDCLIQNAGGMTCHEAAAMGMPIVFFRPLPGHGELNAAVMATASAARRVETADELTALLRDTIAGSVSLAPPRRIGVPVAASVADLAKRQPPCLPVARPAPVGHRWAVAMAAALALLVWLTVTPWTGGVGAMLLPTAVTARDVPAGSVVLVVRVSNPGAAHALEDAIVAERLPVALFVDAGGARGIYPATAVTIGLAEADNTLFLTRPWRAVRSDRSAMRAMRRRTGAGRLYVLPPRDGRTLLASALAPEGSRQLVARRAARHGRHDGLVALDLTGMPPQQAVDALHHELDQLRQEGLRCVPLPSLS
jgi:processive 1,2-diacylglycerol beta-glucosyltransferase